MTVNKPESSGRSEQWLRDILREEIPAIIAAERVLRLEADSAKVAEFRARAELALRAVAGQWEEGRAADAALGNIGDYGDAAGLVEELARAVLALADLLAAPDMNVGDVLPTHGVMRSVGLICTKCGAVPPTPGYLMCAVCAAEGGNQ